jgi:putative tryptophan/tyrosine transport system substrate-binding protein
VKRREFIAGLGSAAVWPLVAHAQQGDRVRRIGVLTPGNENDREGKLRYSAFRQALADLGWTVGRNVQMDLLRWGGGDTNRIRVLAQELVGLQPDVILTGTTAATVALQRETQTTPIVFAAVAEPVASGIVTRLDRPSGNITGFATLETTLGGKWLELLSEIAPGLKRAAIMFNPDTAPVSVYIPSFEMAARSLKVVPITAPIHDDAEIETAIIALGREPRGGLTLSAGRATWWGHLRLRSPRVWAMGEKAAFSVPVLCERCPAGYGKAGAATSRCKRLALAAAMFRQRLVQVAVAPGLPGGGWIACSVVIH